MLSQPCSLHVNINDSGVRAATCSSLQESLSNWKTIHGHLRAAGGLYFSPDPCNIYTQNTCIQTHTRTVCPTDQCIRSLSVFSTAGTWTQLHRMSKQPSTNVKALQVSITPAACVLFEHNLRIVRVLNFCFDFISTKMIPSVLVFAQKHSKMSTLNILIWKASPFWTLS